MPTPSSNADKYEELRSRLTVDSSFISEGLQDQPMFVMEIAEYAAQATHARDVADNNLKFVKASLASQLREVLKSEAAIDKSLDEQEGVVDAKAELAIANFDLALWSSLREAAITLTSSLKYRSELIISGYLTPNSVSTKTKPNLHYKGNRA